MPGIGGGSPGAQPPVGADGLQFFSSTEQTGNGSEQSVSHGLGVVPKLVVVSISYLPALTDIASSPVQLYQTGTHTSSACKVTALSGAKYKVWAVG